MDRRCGFGADSSRERKTAAHQWHPPAATNQLEKVSSVLAPLDQRKYLRLLNKVFPMWWFFFGLFLGTMAERPKPHLPPNLLAPSCVSVADMLLQPSTPRVLWPCSCCPLSTLTTTGASSPRSSMKLSLSKSTSSPEACEPPGKYSSARL